jgi:hypothetical protein
MDTIKKHLQKVLPTHFESEKAAHIANIIADTALLYASYLGKTICICF